MSTTRRSWLVAVTTAILGRGRVAEWLRPVQRKCDGIPSSWPKKIPIDHAECGEVVFWIAEPPAYAKKWVYHIHRDIQRQAESPNV